ncbi:hypothetical protein ROG8370_03029 [Roseovarius gaetbuli]|uniref:Ferrochelatase n=1 Tax=Roseovarius gaetbuli TaxID=1356575 RepID=A0A1X6ZYZ7_9RHOB|nr:hypothetical protein ROG8370_03029 [Roseovarius gaetbuli]
MNKFSIIATAVAISAMTTAPLMAGNVTPVEEEKDPFVAVAPVGSSASGLGTLAMVGGFALAAALVVALADSSSSSTTTP